MVRDGPAPVFEDVMSNEREVAMVAPIAGNDRESSAGGDSRAQEQYIDLGGAEVTPQQEAAIRALIAGMNYTDAAAAAGVDRTTLYRWRTLDTEFDEALETLRRHTQEQTCDSFRSLADASLCAVKDGLARSDAKLGLSVLKELTRAATRAAELEQNKFRKPAKRSAAPERTPRQQAVWEAMGKMTPWQYKNPSSVIEMGIAAYKAQMAAKFRAHFGLPDDFPVNREQLDLAASGALPDPATYDPRKVGWDYRKSASEAEENSKK